MDKALQIQVAIIVFILFLCIVCLFAVMMVLHNVIAESNKKEPEKVKQPEPKEEPVLQNNPVKEIVEKEEEKSDDNSVVFSSYILTMPERYAALSLEYKRYFDDIVRYVLSKENVKEIKNNYSYIYKNASNRILRLTIKRGEVICELSFIDREIKNYVAESDVPIKTSATSVKVTEPAAVGVVKDGIDLVCSQITAYREYKKQLAREKRKEKSKQKKMMKL